jgi:hypothetical protein
MHEPLPRTLEVDTTFKVTDSNGRILRSEDLPAGTDLPDRLRLAHRNYQLQGWTVGPLLHGRWSFFAEKANQRVLIGIRHPSPAGGSSREAVRPPTMPTDPVNQPARGTGDSRPSG